MPLWHPPAPQTPISVPGASPNTGLSPGITYASPTVPFYSSGSVIPSNLVVSTLTAVSETVSGFINLDGNILTTASGVGAELLLNGIPIATTANISSIQAWAEFPAISTVNANSNLITNISSLVGIPGQPLPILASQVAFGGLGELTGISTINGAPPGSGNAAGWATYPATQDVNMNSFNLNSANQVNLNTGGNVVMLTAGTGNNLLVNGTPVGGGGGGAVSTISGSNTFMTATGTSGTATSAIAAGGGLGGFITATANPGSGGISGGNITLTANGGTTPAGVFGRVDIVANEGVANVAGTDITTGGYVNIVANSGGALANLTSRIDLNAGGINMYAGITTPITSLFGYGFINALTGLSLVAGTFSSAFQVPGTVYLYGLTGIVLGSDTYATKIYPYWNGLTAPPNLELNGRTTISGVARVNINNANNISFDALGAGSISGVQTINGAPYVPGGGGGVASLNGLTGALTLTAGTNISLVPVGNNITINSSGGSYPAVASFSTIIMNPSSGVINANAIINPPTNANEFGIAQENATGDLYMNVRPGAVGPVVGEVRINNSGIVAINETTAGKGININSDGNELQFLQTALAVNQGQIVGLSTINGVAYAPAGAGVVSLNGQSGGLTLQSIDSSVAVNSVGGVIDLSVALPIVKNISVQPGTLITATTLGTAQTITSVDIQPTISARNLSLQASITFQTNSNTKRDIYFFLTVDGVQVGNVFVSSADGIGHYVNVSVNAVSVEDNTNHTCAVKAFASTTAVFTASVCSLTATANLA